VQTTTSMILDGLPINPTVQKQITINHIFSHNHNWDVYRHAHGDELRDVEIKEVEKMLKCDTLGFRLFSCPNCGEFELVHFGCNSRLCTHCGKRFTDDWADSIARKTFNVKHRHVVLTIPEDLRSVFYEDRTLLKVLMDCAIRTVSDVIEWRLNYKATPGIVVVLHTYDNSLRIKGVQYLLMRSIEQCL